MKTKDNKDITATGPVGLRGLKGINNYRQDNDYTDLYSAAKSGNQHAERLIDLMAKSPKDYTNYAQFYEPSPAPEATGLGESKYDSPILFNPSQDRIQNMRAEAQSGALQMANGITKGIITAGTTFVDGTVGLLTGLIGAGITGKADYIWDNPITNAMQSITDASEELLPNYRSTEEEERPFWENMFSGQGAANFWGDVVLKNAGFTIGAFYSGGIWNSAVRTLGKGAFKLAKMYGAGYKAAKNIAKTTNWTAATVHATASAAAEGSIEALNNSRDWFNSHKLQIDQYYGEALEDLKNKYVEGSPEYLQAEQQLAEAYQQSLSDLDNEKKIMGNYDLLMNIPILTLSNLVQFGRFMANGFKTTRKALNIKGNWNNFRAGTTNKRIALGSIKGIVTEGSEELSQRIAADASGYWRESALINSTISNFRDAKYDINAELDTVDFMKALGKSVSTNFKDPKAWEEFFVGALYGALGMPSFRSSRTKDGNFQSPIYLQGGMYNEIKQGIKKREEEERVANYLNSRANDPEFQNYYRGIIRNKKFENDKLTAAKNGDAKNFKDSEFNQLISDIQMFDSAGKLDILKEQIKIANDSFEDADIEDILESTKRTITADQQKEEIQRQIEDINQEIINVKNDSSHLLDIDKIEKDIERLEREKEEKGILHRYRINKKIKQLQKRKEQLLYNSRITDTKRNENLQKLETKRNELINRLNTETFKDKVISPFMDDNGNPMSKDEIKKKIQENIAETNKTIKDYINIKDELQFNYGDIFSDEQLETLMWLGNKRSNITRRSMEIIQSLKGIYDDLTKNTEPKKLKELREKLSELEQKEGFDKNSEEYKKAKEELETEELKIKLLKVAFSSVDFDIENDNVEERIYKASNLYANPLVAMGLSDLLLTRNTTSLLNQTLGTKDYKDTDIYNSEARKIQDLAEMTQELMEYNLKLKEYLNNPEKLSQDIENSTQQSKKKKENKNIENLIKRLNFKGNESELLKSINDNKEEIDKLGGIKELKKYLDLDQLEKLNSALNTQNIKSAILDTLDNESDTIKNILSNMIDDIIDKISNPTDVNAIREALRDKITQGDLKDYIEESDSEFDPHNIDKLSELEKQVWQTFEKKKEDIEKAVRSASKINFEREAQEKLEREVREGTEAIPDPDEAQVEQEEIKDEEKEIKQELEEDKKTQQQLPTTTKKDLDNNKKQVIDSPSSDPSMEKAYANRPQLSQFYFHGKDLKTYLEFIKEHKEWIPEGIDKDAYINYLEQTYKYLEEKGAFNYINSGQLHSGDKIIFISDPELNQRAGTFVPLIVKVDSNGQKQVIGTFKTEFEFDSRSKYYKNGKVTAREKQTKEILKQQYNLFKEIKRRFESKEKEEPITTTINNILGGQLALSTDENTVSDIIGENNIPVIAVNSPNGITNKTNQDTQFIQPQAEDWSIFLMIKSITGKYLPALCYSTKLSELINNEHDWYINQIIEVLNKLNHTNSKDISRELRSWLNLSGLMVDIGISGRNNWKDATSVETSTHIRISYYENDKKQYITIPIKDSTPKEYGMKLLKQLIHKFPNITTNVDINKLNPSANSDYLKHIAKYLHTNIVKGKTNTINDWFTFELPSNFKDNKRARRQDTQGRNTEGIKFTYNRIEYTIKEDVVYDKNGDIITNDTLKQRILNKYHKDKLKEKVKAPKESQKSDNSSNAAIDILNGLTLDDKTHNPKTKQKKEQESGQKENGQESKKKEQNKRKLKDDNDIKIEYTEEQIENAITIIQDRYDLSEEDAKTMWNNLSDTQKSSILKC